MPESTSYMFTLKEVTQILLKHLGIKKGHWGIAIQFAFSGGAAPIEHEGEMLIRPIAIIPVIRVGIQKHDKQSDSTVDASSVDSAPAKKPKTKSK